MTKLRQPSTPALENLQALLPDVTPLRQRNRAPLAKAQPAPAAQQRVQKERAVLVESLSDSDPWEASFETGDELQFLRGGLASDTLRKLRRGHWGTQNHIDLHGLTVAEARPVLVAFLNACLHQGLRCVRIIHGKGLGSKNGTPVLKRKVFSWLMQRDEILAFCQARHTEGGSGAVVVLLRGIKHPARR